MNPNLKDHISNELEFRRIKGRKLIVNFEGGRITSDAGIVWIAELDKKLKITAKFALMLSRLSSFILCRSLS